MTSKNTTNGGGAHICRFVLTESEATFLSAYKITRGHKAIGPLAHQLLAERIAELVKQSGFVPPTF
jgi:hypothetical protein